jgi:hypothetical protein
MPAREITIHAIWMIAENRLKAPARLARIRLDASRFSPA